MAVTAKSRSALALTVTTRMEPKAALNLAAGVCAEVKGGGASLLTTGVANVGAQVHIRGRSDSQLRLSITSGKRVIELCTFSARANRQNGKTNLTVGGLETYKTSQPRLFFLIPVGPKMILGYDPYKRYLQAVAAAVQAADATARVRIDGDGQ